MADKKKKKTRKNSTNDLSPVMMVGVFVIFVLSMIFITYFGMNLSSPISKYFSVYNNKITNELSRTLEKQKETDNAIKKVISEKKNTIDNPYIIVNPYTINDLSALIIFNTEQDTYVKLRINDVDVTTMEKSTDHIIPIYYLYSDAVNLIQLTLDDGKTNTVEISTKTHDKNIYGFDVASQIGTNDVYYLLGDINMYNSSLRGFDLHGNQISNITLGYLGGFTLYKNKIAIAYNQNKEFTSDLRLDIDYLGRINNITSNTSDIKYESNISGDGIEYIGASYNIYSSLTANYSFNEVANNDSYTESNKLSLDAFEDRLRGAVKYPGVFKVSYMDDYISFNGDSSATLYIVSEFGSLVSYNIENKGIIRTDIKGNKSLYITVDGIMYSLKTTLED